MNTKDKGDVTEGLVLSALLQAGHHVLVPFGDNLRYDMVFEDDSGFHRVQCKTGRLRDGAVRFKPRSSYYHRGRQSQDYRTTADFFGVFCPETSAVYLVPVDHVGTSEATLRVEPSRNNQTTGVRNASDYLLKPNLDY